MTMMFRSGCVTSLVNVLVLILACYSCIGSTQPFYVECDRTTDRGSCSSTDIAFCNGPIMGVTPQDVTITTFPTCVRPAETFTLALTGSVAIIHADKGTGVSTPSVDDGSCPTGVLFDSFGQFTSVDLTAPLGETTMEILLVQATGRFNPVRRQLGTVQVTASCPTPQPTSDPTFQPTTLQPTESPTTPVPTGSPTTPMPTISPSSAPTGSPTTPQPTDAPSTPQPTGSPSQIPTRAPVTPGGFFDDPANVAAVAGGAAAGLAVLGAAAAYSVLVRPRGAKSHQLKNLDL